MADMASLAKATNNEELQVRVLYLPHGELAELADARRFGRCIELVLEVAGSTPVL